eukprot:TRINITY_DN44726_c0_g1_i1.p1 TRINITY_DN44726_c0_g1~~TRINITY_DN44726_c0_g1_i1.p1  ORF type:complete len:841 (+),score=139.16 TRINITY_DN44726_c0_g1_i1:85-2607(+)
MAALAAAAAAGTTAAVSPADVHLEEVAGNDNVLLLTTLDYQLYISVCVDPNEEFFANASERLTKAMESFPGCRFVFETGDLFKPKPVLAWLVNVLRSTKRFDEFQLFRLGTCHMAHHESPLFAVGLGRNNLQLVRGSKLALAAALEEQLSLNVNELLAESSDVTVECEDPPLHNAPIAEAVQGVGDDAVALSQEDVDDEKDGTEPPWVRVHDEELGCLYYWNEVTGESSWSPPPPAGGEAPAEVSPFAAVDAAITQERVIAKAMPARSRVVGRVTVPREPPRRLRAEAAGPTSGEAGDPLVVPPWRLNRAVTPPGKTPAPRRIVPQSAFAQANGGRSQASAVRSAAADASGAVPTERRPLPRVVRNPRVPPAILQGFAAVVAAKIEEKAREKAQAAKPRALEEPERGIQEKEQPNGALKPPLPRARPPLAQPRKERPVLLRRPRQESRDHRVPLLLSRKRVASGSEGLQRSAAKRPRVAASEPGEANVDAEDERKDGAAGSAPTRPRVRPLAKQRLVAGIRRYAAMRGVSSSQGAAPPRPAAVDVRSPKRHRQPPAECPGDGASSSEAIASVLPDRYVDAVLDSAIDRRGDRTRRVVVKGSLGVSLAEAAATADIPAAKKTAPPLPRRGSFAARGSIASANVSRSVAAESVSTLAPTGKGMPSPLAPSTPGKPSDARASSVQDRGPVKEAVKLKPRGSVGARSERSEPSPTPSATRLGRSGKRSSTTRTVILKRPTRLRPRSDTVNGLDESHGADSSDGDAAESRRRTSSRKPSRQSTNEPKPVLCRPRRSSSRRSSHRRLASPSPHRSSPKSPRAVRSNLRPRVPYEPRWSTPFRGSET